MKSSQLGKPPRRCTASLQPLKHKHVDYRSAILSYHARWISCCRDFSGAWPSRAICSTATTLKTVYYSYCSEGWQFSRFEICDTVLKGTHARPARFGDDGGKVRHSSGIICSFTLHLDHESERRRTVCGKLSSNICWHNEYHFMLVPDTNVVCWCHLNKWIDQDTAVVCGQSIVLFCCFLVKRSIRHYPYLHSSM